MPSAGNLYQTLIGNKAKVQQRPALVYFVFFFLFPYPKEKFYFSNYFLILGIPKLELETILHS